jgi:BolA protein
VNDTIQEMKRRLASLDPLHLEIVDESALHAGHAGAKSGGGH